MSQNTTDLPFLDVPLPPLVARGDAHSVGVALGRHAAVALRSVFPQRLTPEVVKWRGSQYLSDLRQAAQQRFPDAFAELEGLALGAGVSFEDVFLLNCISDLPLVDSPADSGCTTLVIPAGDDADAPTIIAHNEDVSLTAVTPWFFARIERYGYPAFTSLCYAGKLPGTAVSANNSGLIQTINDIRPLEWQVGVPRGFLARAILDCSDTTAALETIRTTVRASGYHHTIASARSGLICSVEAPSRAMVAVPVRRPQAHANHLLYPPLNSIREYVVGGSHFRQAFGEAQLKYVRTGALAAARAADASGKTLAQTPSNDNDWHKTIVTAIFELRSRSVEWVAYGDDGSEVFREHIEICAENSHSHLEFSA